MNQRNPYVEGKSCLACGSLDSDEFPLEFHHRVPRSPTQNHVSIYWVTYRQTLARAEHARMRLEQEIAKCDILCAGCHRKTHGKRPRIVCGTIGAYTHKRCRCEPCKAAWRAYSKQYGVNKAKHGTTGYAHGCRCDICRTERNAYQNKLRARKKAQIIPR